MISFIHCGSEKRLYRFPSGNTSQLMLGRRWLAISVHSNSLVKSLTPFEDDAEIHLLNFLMQPICEQPEEKNLASLKIDFYFEIFKQLKNHVLSSGVISQEQHSMKTLEFTKTNSWFYSFTYEKKNIFSSSSYQWVDFFVNLLADKKAVDSTPKYYLLA